MRFLKEFSAAFGDLLALRISSSFAQAAIDFEKNEVEKLLAEIAQHAQLIKEHEFKPDADAPTLGILKARLAADRAKLSIHGLKGAALLIRDLKRQIDATENTVSLSAKVTATIPEFVLAIRTELELPIDAQEYRQLFENFQQASTQATRDLIQRTRQEFDSEVAAKVKELFPSEGSPPSASVFETPGPTSTAS